MMSQRSSDPGFDSDKAEAAYYDDSIDKAVASMAVDDTYDESLEGAVSVIANKEAREIALKAYKAGKAAKKQGKKGRGK
jgi:hypothetical protein